MFGPTVAAKSHLKGQEQCSQLLLSTPPTVDLLYLLDCLFRAVSQAEVLPEILKQPKVNSLNSLQRSRQCLGSAEGLKSLVVSLS